jgi:hypothetical protein
MQDVLPHEEDGAVAPPRFRPRPWDQLESPYDAELWIEEHNLALRELIRPGETGYGVRFTLAAGGDIYLQTSADGAVVLDVTDEAEWVAPLLMAAAGVDHPGSSLWILPDDKLIQLVLGLSGLVSESTLVVGHPFGLKQRRSLR